MKKLILITLIVTAFMSCSKDDPDTIVLTLSEKTLNFGDEHQIDAKSKSPILYLSENEYHATVSEKGLVKARFVGETDITLTNEADSKNFKVIISPTNTLYQEPKVNFGATKSDIIQKYGIPSSQSSEMMLYEDYTSKTPGTFFVFKAERLTSYGLLVKTAYSSELGKFLGERYKLLSIDYDGFSFLFMNALNEEKATLIVGTMPYNTSYWMVVYIFTEGLTKSAKIDNSQKNLVIYMKENLK